MNSLIITGGNINKNLLKTHLETNKYDIIIAVDKGLEFLGDIKPDYIVGDFDSVNIDILKKYESLGVKIKRLIPEKDFTDTESALDFAINMKVSELTIIGGIRNESRPQYCKYTYIKNSLG